MIGGYTPESFELARKLAAAVAPDAAVTAAFVKAMKLDNVLARPLKLAVEVAERIRSSMLDEGDDAGRGLGAAVRALADANSNGSGHKDIARDAMLAAPAAAAAVFAERLRSSMLDEGDDAGRGLGAAVLALGDTLSNGSDHKDIARDAMFAAPAAAAAVFAGRLCSSMLDEGDDAGRGLGAAVLALGEALSNGSDHRLIAIDKQRKRARDAEPPLVVPPRTAHGEVSLKSWAEKRTNWDRLEGFVTLDAARRKFECLHCEDFSGLNCVNDNGHPTASQAMRHVRKFHAAALAAQEAEFESESDGE
jgi:hypothetical protein